MKKKKIILIFLIFGFVIMSCSKKYDKFENANFENKFFYSGNPDNSKIVNDGIIFLVSDNLTKIDFNNNIVWKKNNLEWQKQLDKNFEYDFYNVGIELLLIEEKQITVSSRVISKLNSKIYQIIFYLDENANLINQTSFKILAYDERFISVTSLIKYNDISVFFLFLDDELLIYNKDIFIKKIEIKNKYYNPPNQKPLFFIDEYSFFAYGAIYNIDGDLITDFVADKILDLDIDDNALSINVENILGFVTGKAKLTGEHIFYYKLDIDKRIFEKKLLNNKVNRRSCQNIHQIIPYKNGFISRISCYIYRRSIGTKIEGDQIIAYINSDFEMIKAYSFAKYDSERFFENKIFPVNIQVINDEIYYTYFFNGETLVTKILQDFDF